MQIIPICWVFLDTFRFLNLIWKNAVDHKVSTNDSIFVHPIQVDIQDFEKLFDEKKNDFSILDVLKFRQVRHFWRLSSWLKNGSISKILNKFRRINKTGKCLTSSLLFDAFKFATEFWRLLYFNPMKDYRKSNGRSNSDRKFVIQVIYLIVQCIGIIWNLLE